MKKNPSFFLNHILESIEEIENYLKNTSRDVFIKDLKTQDAVIRRLEIIGEATKNLSKEFTSKYPEIEWRKIAGLRDVIVHDYFGISLKLVWNITQKEIPELKPKIKKIIDSLYK